jgi:hypothetical protein
MARSGNESSTVFLLSDELPKDSVDGKRLFGQDGLRKQLKNRKADPFLET